MAEEKETHQHDHSSQSNVTPASNQNLIIGIVMGAVVLLLLLLVISQQFGKKDESDESKKLAEMEKKLEERQARSDAMRYASVAGVGASPEALISQIKNDTEALGRLVNATQSNAAMLQTAQDSADAMRRRVTDLEAQLRQYQAAAARVQGLETELQNARTALAGTVDKASVDSLRDQLARAKTERDTLQTELNQLRASQAGMVDSNVHALLQAERNDLLAKNAALRAEVQRLLAQNSSNLFVSGEDLSPRAVALYRELKRIENEDHNTRRQIYNRFDAQLKASVSEKITFKTGKADIAPEHEAHIREMAGLAPANTFFLVVGYASPSGDSQNNEELSSRRATRVASMVNYLKKTGQEVQAVYLGEGNRFGPEDSPNQACEVWQIRP